MEPPELTDEEALRLADLLIPSTVLDGICPGTSRPWIMRVPSTVTSLNYPSNSTTRHVHAVGALTELPEHFIDGSDKDTRTDEQITARRAAARQLVDDPERSKIVVVALAAPTALR